RRLVPESPRWREQWDSGAPLAPWRELFGKGRARTTWCAALMMTCLIFGLWSSTFWIPTLVSTWQAAQGESAQAAQHLGSLSGLIMSVGTLAGCAGMPWIVRVFATRRRAAAFFFTGAAVCNMLAYGLLVMTLKSLALFMCMLPLLGFFTSGVFSLYTIWLPEMFPTMLRALGSGFAFSFGRIVGAVGPVLVGALAAAFRSYPLAITLVSAIYLVGLPLVFLAPETAGRRLRT
ncbi:MFS transporter, partial [Burkholderia sp. Cy-647]|nr:MFS transporter [Burkholderia sp. Cy-647]